MTAEEVWQKACAAYEDAAEEHPEMPLRDMVIAGENAAVSVIRTAMEAMCETLAGALEEVKSSMLNGGDGQDGDFGWNITKLNRSRATVREALTQYRAMKEKNDG